MKWSYMGTFDQYVAVPKTKQLILLNRSIFTFPNYREECIIRYMTKYRIAEKIGVSHQAVYKWYAGKSLPSSAHLLALSKLLNKNIDTLIKEFQRKNPKR